MKPQVFLLFALTLGSFAPLRAQSISIVDTKHNLSVSGPGTYKATTESQICIFCHTPHRSRSSAPLWNREDSTETYLPYTSSTFDGGVTQPTGGSKLCLSCHDGSIALGNVVSLVTDIEMVAGKERLDAGPAFIGTNLMDDHPISFHYGQSQGGSGNEFLPEGSIQPPVHLDAQGMMQCTSCHDPHNNLNGNFLLTSDLHSQLCLSCHVKTGWDSASHAISGAAWNGAAPDPWPMASYATVAENACANCHQVHGAGHAERLLVFPAEEDNCLACHNGNVASKDIQAAVSRPSGHDPFFTSGLHDPEENPLDMPRHSECQDCHDPHAVQPGTAPPPGVPGPNLNTSGVNSSGQPIPEITFLYELCFKCHADNNGGAPFVSRWIFQLNTRLEFDPANPSFHPVETPGINPDVPSLLPPWTTSSLVACTDCHQAENSPTFGGGGAAGPHGSIYPPLLGARYVTTDGVSESSSTYALCYRCHNRSSILDDQTFEEHKKHIVGEDVSCAACHDAHGISNSQGTPMNNSHLINFDLTVVSPAAGQSAPVFTDLGNRRGTCTLVCHDEEHDDKSYGPGL